ncbi:MAG TPA: hypothetical protein ENK02_08490 [Planctomycetes bacterium]|nr:hypothetical protein [Planctomycetota bacterium]
MSGIPGARRLSPQGEGGVAVLALPRSRAESWLRSQGLGPPPVPGKIRLVRLRPRLGGLGEGFSPELEALLVGSPRGEWVELHLPGNPVLVGALAEDGWGPEEGFMEGGVSPLEEECLRVAQGAPTSRGAALALSQIGEGGWVSRLDQVEPGERGLMEELRVARENWGRFQGLLVPTRLLLRGRTNAGKSTLFNLLLGVERVRTGPQAGLTLDPVSEGIQGLGWPFVLVDTAGEREVGAGLEREAIRRGRGLSEDALVVQIRSLAEQNEDVRDVKEGAAVPALTCYSHADLYPGGLRSEDGEETGAGRALVFDLKTGDPDAIRAAFFHRVLEVLGRRAFPDPEGVPCLISPRQKTLVDQILGSRNGEARRRAWRELKGGL